MLAPLSPGSPGDRQRHFAGASTASARPLSPRQFGRAGRQAIEGLTEAAESLLTPLKVTPVASGVLDLVSKTDPFTVRTLDAIHPEAAIRFRARGSIDTVLTFDKQLRAGCEHHAIPLAAVPEANQAEVT